METGQLPTLEQMADRLAIEDVLNKHCRGVDRASEADLKSAYWPEAEVAYGSFNGNAHEFCAMLPTGIRQYVATSHRVTNIMIDIKGPDAVVESYVTAYHYRASTNDSDDTELTYIGRYIDHMQKRDDVWKIMMRHVVMDWNQNLTSTAVLTTPPFNGLARSARAPDDPLYTLKQKIIGD